MQIQNNNFQQQIANLIKGANHSIKVAVSWFTDELLIKLLIQMATRVKVEVLLSNDNYNLLQHKLFKELINQGGKVRKFGSKSVLAGGFMHTKKVIIDDQVAFGGSYNFTKNAKSHFEQFKRWDASEIRSILDDFNNWFEKADDYFLNVANPEEVVRQLQQQFVEEQNEDFEAIELNFSNFQEEEYISKKEKEVVAKRSEMTLSVKRETATLLSTQKASINSYGKVENNTLGVVSKSHKFYGGVTSLIKKSYSTSRTYPISAYQKHNLERRYNFLKCNIINGTLIITGELQPELCDLYKIRIEFREGHTPMVFITSPHIVHQPAIHIYKEGCLCLYYPGDFKWRNSTKIADYTIPWIVEWILYYEIWKITGKWEGAEHVH